MINLERAIKFAHLAGFTKEDLIVMTLTDDCKFPDESNSSLTDYVQEVVTTTADSNVTDFPRLQNAIRKIALERHYDFYLWQHTDAVIVPTVPNVRSHILSGVQHAAPSWGVLFFAYDWLAAYRVSGLSDLLMWDEKMPHYGGWGASKGTHCTSRTRTQAPNSYFLEHFALASA